MGESYCNDSVLSNNLSCSVGPTPHAHRLNEVYEKTYRVLKIRNDLGWN